MDPEQKGRSLNVEEEKEFREGSALKEMVELSAGWQIVKKMLDNLAFHSWVDPRTVDSPDAEKEWKWRELNAFHAANNAKELLDTIDRLISRAEHLGNIKSGEVKDRGMKI